MKPVKPGEMDATRLTETFKQSILLNFRTGNMFIDILIQMLLVSIIGWVTVRGSAFYASLKSLFTKSNETYGSITYTFDMMRSQDKFISYYAPIEINAIVWFLTQSKTKGVYVQMLQGTSGGAYNWFIPKGSYQHGDFHIQFTSDLPTNVGTSSIEKNTCVVSSKTVGPNEIKQFVDDLIEKHKIFKMDVENAKKTATHYIWAPKNENLQTYPFETTRSFDNYFFEGKDEMLSHLDFFINNQDWYQRKGIPWTLGMCLSGPPGTGKTSSIKAIAKHTKRDVLCVPLKEVRDLKDLMTIFNSTTVCSQHMSVTKRIVVLEDIDCLSDVVRKRTSVESLVEAGAGVGAGPGAGVGTETGTGDTKKDDDPAKLLMKIVTNEMHKSSILDDRLTLSDLLNVMDGILESHGRIMIITTNHPENLDPALMRPGRIDYHIKFKLCSVDILNQIVCHFFDIPVGDIGFGEYVDERFSPAHVVCTCKQLMRRGYEGVVEQLNREAMMVV